MYVLNTLNQLGAPEPEPSLMEKIISTGGSILIYIFIICIFVSIIMFFVSLIKKRNIYSLCFWICSCIFSCLMPKTISSIMYLFTGTAWMIIPKGGDWFEPWVWTYAELIHDSPFGGHYLYETYISEFYWYEVIDAVDIIEMASPVILIGLLVFLSIKAKRRKS